MTSDREYFNNILSWIESFIESSLFVATCLYAQKKKDSVEQKFLEDFDMTCQSLMFHITNSTDATKINSEIENLKVVVTNYLDYVDNLEQN